jgi:uncharacterized phage protein gp47/JayE
MALIRPSYEEILERIFRIMEARGFQPRPDSSAIGALARAIAIEMTNYYDLIQILEEQNNIDTASGPSLDRIGAMFGLFRRPSSPASSIGTPSAVKITNNSTSAVTVPANTRVWSSSNPQRYYFTVSEITLGAGEEGYVHVVAGGYGGTYHVKARELDSIAIDNLSVTNPYDITNSEEEEDDDTFRARIANAFLRRYYGSETAIRYGLEEIPGVHSVRLISGSRGPGTLDVVLVPVQIPPSNELISAAYERLRAEVVPGIDYRLIVPRAVPVDVQVRLNWKSRPGNRISSEQIRDTLSALIDTSPLDDGSGNASISVSEIITRIMNLSPSISDVQVRVFLDGVEVSGVLQVGSNEIMRLRHVEVL